MVLTPARRRRRNVSGSGLSTTPADFTQLVTDVGLPVVAAYDVRPTDPNYGVVQAGGVVSAWNDVRGVATYPGNSMAAAGSAQPAWDGVSINHDGADDYLVTPVIAALDLGTDLSWITVVAAMPSGVLGGFGAVVRNAAGTRYMGIRSDAGSGANYQGREADTVGATNLGMGAALGATFRHITLANRNAGPRETTFQTPNLAASLFIPGGVMSVEGYQLAVGGLGPATNPIAIKVKALIAWKGYPTAGQIATVQAWAQTAHGAVAA